MGFLDGVAQLLPLVGFMSGLGLPRPDIAEGCAGQHAAEDQKSQRQDQSRNAGAPWLLTWLVALRRRKAGPSIQRRACGTHTKNNREPPAALSKSQKLRGDG